MDVRLNRSFGPSSLLILIFWGNGGCAESQPIQVKPSITLPTDQNVIVISMDMKGGGPAIPRLNTDPLLSIYSDGTVVVTDPHKKDGKVVSRIAPEKLQELLQFIGCVALKARRRVADTDKGDNHF